MASLVDLLLGRSGTPSAGDGGWRYAANPVGTETAHVPQEMRSADGQPFDPVGAVVAGTPITRGEVQDWVRQGWNTANSVSDAGLGAPGMMGAIRAYHGSPHSFERFDLARIGTGEGAQAYGHGLYFAGNEGVARGYRDALSGANVDARNFVRNGEIVPDLGAVWQQSADAAKSTMAMPNDHASAIARQVRQWVEGGRRADTFLQYNEPPRGYESAYAAAVQPWIGISYKKNPGHMYEVNLNVEPGQLLDWDKPMGQQPWEVKQALYRRADIGDSAPGYRIPHSLATTPQAQAVALREAGIPGVQYLDAGSRAAGNGTRNYVMFDDSLINILRKYAVPGMVMGGAAAVNPFMGGTDAQ